MRRGRSHTLVPMEAPRRFITGIFRLILVVGIAGCGPRQQGSQVEITGAGRTSEAVAHARADRAKVPLRLDPSNPHYFFFRGQPTVLVGSTEHYGAVINGDFNYVTYLDELARSHLNLTRTWVGSYLEVRSDYNPAKSAYAIDLNTLAPRPERYLCPWPRSGVPGAADGLSKFDLARCDPNYFSRLKDFLQEAGKRGIVAELNLFCSFYTDDLWNASPMNPRNNVNLTGNIPRNEVYALRHADLLRVQDSMVREIVRAAREFDNVYFEICNEPYYGGVSPEWQRHISNVVVETEKPFRYRHLIAQNTASGSEVIEDPDPDVAICNFHYSRPPDSVAMNYRLNRAIGVNETGFDGQADAIYRVQGWDFLVAGGALYNNLDFSFAVGHERGDFLYKGYTPGGGSAALRKQLGVLQSFLQALPLISMRPENSIIKGGVPAEASARVLASRGKVYVIYIHHGHVRKNAQPQYAVDASPHQLALALELPPGSYDAAWLIPQTGTINKRERFIHAGEVRTLASPVYSEDVALLIQATQ